MSLESTDHLVKVDIFGPEEDDVVRKWGPNKFGQFKFGNYSSAPGSEITAKFGVKKFGRFKFGVLNNQGVPKKIIDTVLVSQTKAGRVRAGAQTRAKYSVIDTTTQTPLYGKVEAEEIELTKV